MRIRLENRIAKLEHERQRLLERKVSDEIDHMTAEQRRARIQELHDKIRADLKQRYGDKLPPSNLLHWYERWALTVDGTGDLDGSALAVEARLSEGNPSVKCASLARITRDQMQIPH